MNSSGFSMQDESDRRERQAGPRAGNPKQDQRQDRLRQALRENLKRRKTQARGRGDLTQPSAETMSSNGNTPSPYHGNDDKPDE
jgi:hypothetical protein